MPIEVLETAATGLESLVEAMRKKPESQPDAKPAAKQRLCFVMDMELAEGVEPPTL